MPLLWLSLAFVTGIILAANYTLPTSTWLILAGASLVLMLARYTLKRLNVQHINLQRLTSHLPVPIPILALALTLGAARYQTSLPNPNDPSFIAYYNDSDQIAVVTGVVSDFPDVRDTYTNLRIQTDEIQPAGASSGTEVHGLILARCRSRENTITAIVWHCAANCKPRPRTKTSLTVNTWPAKGYTATCPTPKLRYWLPGRPTPSWG